ncbi:MULTISPECIES: hypothetical protein [Bacillus]|uniref:hypothetical protein n=1 Tax=Bacillus TaxID=1386 RepID=UPI001F572713|nr:hypothetical protein [Bacillus cereus group sp. BfR-BA-01403]
MKQSGKGGDFLSVFLKKYYLFLVKILALKEKEKKRPTFSWSFFKISKGLFSPFDIRREGMLAKSGTIPVIPMDLAFFLVFIFDSNCVHF